MAEKCKTTGKIITNVKLWCVDASGELPWGKWDTNPKNEIGPSLEETGDIAFVALGADSSATGNKMLMEPALLFILTILIRRITLQLFQ